MIYLTANTAKCLCKRGFMVKLPAVGFMQDTYCVLKISFKVSFARSYLCVSQYIFFFSGHPVYKYQSYHYQ